MAATEYGPEAGQNVTGRIVTHWQRRFHFYRPSDNKWVTAEGSLRNDLFTPNEELGLISHSY
jgi:hypothetical protein